MAVEGEHEFDNPPPPKAEVIALDTGLHLMESKVVSELFTNIENSVVDCIATAAPEYRVRFLHKLAVNNSDASKRWALARSLEASAELYISTLVGTYGIPYEKISWTIKVVD